MKRTLNYLLTLIMFASLNGIEQSRAKRAAPSKIIPFKEASLELKKSFQDFLQSPRIIVANVNPEFLRVPLILDGELSEQCYLMNEIFDPMTVANENEYFGLRKFALQLNDLINEPGYMNLVEKLLILLKLAPHCEQDPVIYYDFRIESSVTALTLWHKLFLNFELLATGDVSSIELNALTNFARFAKTFFAKYQ